MFLVPDARAAYTPLEDEFESWYWLPAYSTRILLLRLLVHPCAPGFAMLMGVRIFSAYCAWHPFTLTAPFRLEYRTLCDLERQWVGQTLAY